MAEPALGPEDHALLDRIARRVIRFGLEVPAILVLEGSMPLSLLAGQTLLFFEPLVLALLRFPDYRRFARLVERRDALEALARRIEALAEDARQARRRRPGPDATP